MGERHVHHGMHGSSQYTVRRLWFAPDQKYTVHCPIFGPVFQSSDLTKGKNDF